MFQILLAFLAGVLTIAAPCILLPLPILFGSSVGQASRTRPLFIALGFVATFYVLGLSLNFIIQNLGLSPNALRNSAAVLLAIFALFMVWPTPFERLSGRLSFLINKAGETGQKAGQGNWGGLVLGVVIGIVWAPCAGPILGSILTLIAQQSDLSRASALLVAYAIGSGVPMLAVAYGGQYLTTRIRFVARYAMRLQQFFGIVIFLVAASVFFQYDTYIQAKLTQRFPSLLYIEYKLAGSPAPTLGSQAELGDFGQAPEFAGIDAWLNSEPLTMAGLRGKVVLIDFWTYSCINCIRTLPHVTGWYNKYKDRGLVVVGVHTPEFAFEKLTENVRRAVEQNGIKYPVAQDNDYQTWNAYSNHYWPAEYLIDQNGRIVYTHFGEGNYDKTENAIRQLLGMIDVAGSKAGNGGYCEDGGLCSGDKAAVDFSKIKSPEMYFGTYRMENLAAPQKPSMSGAFYSMPREIPLNNYGLSGYWRFEPEKAVLKGPGKIVLRFSAAKVHMVASAEKPVSANIIIDGTPAGEVTFGISQLYTLFSSQDYSEHVIEIDIRADKTQTFEAFTFTFG